MVGGPGEDSSPGSSEHAAYWAIEKAVMKSAPKRSRDVRRSSTVAGINVCQAWVVCGFCRTGHRPQSRPVPRAGWRRGSNPRFR
jgi:hypothetical protein